MSYYYVDFENVKTKGLNGICKLNANDVVKIFYSKDAQSITFGLHRRINDSKAKFIFRRINNNIKSSLKNALDVMLLEDISEIIKSDKNAEFHIVSLDSDYDIFIKKMQKEKIQIDKIDEICKTFCSDRNVDLEKKEQRFRSFFGRNLQNKYGQYRENIVEAYMNGKTRQEINNQLQKYFYNEDVSEILYIIREYIKDLPGRAN